MRVEDVYSPERIQLIKSWSKKLTYKSNTQAGLILDTLMEGPKKYSELLEIEIRDLARNVAFFEHRIKVWRDYITLEPENTEEFQGYIKGYEADIHQHKEDPMTPCYKRSLQPNHCTVISVMLVEKVIAKISWGKYKITNKGRNIIKNR